MRGERVQLGDLHIEGRSWAGEETWFRVRPPGLAFDVGRGAVQLAGARDLLISHGHLDHALGVPYVLSQRTLHRQERTRVLCPARIVRPLIALIEAAAAMEAATYDYQVVGLEPGERIEVGPRLAVEAFAVDHGVAGLGFHLLRRSRRLLPALEGESGPDLARRRQRGEPVEEEIEELALSYCGDTGSGVFDSEPRLFTARVLLLECTFLAAGQEERARRFGHLHLADLEARAQRFENEYLVLHHLSRRFRRAELEAEIARRLPLLAGRVHLLLGPR
ncbi:MAG: MBL fold metallo-hydrolase [Thermoanaerobaculia bacterium]